MRKLVLLFAALLPLLVLTGCDDGKPKVGDRVTYGFGETGKEEIFGKDSYIWLVEKTENTATFGRLDGFSVYDKSKPKPWPLINFAKRYDRVVPLSRVPWIEKHVDQVPMPEKGWRGPEGEGGSSSAEDAAVERAVEVLKNKRQ